MITDEQVNVAMKTWSKRRALNAFSNNTAYCFDFDAMKEALEAYEASKWVKLDVDDKNTHPPYEQDVLVKCRYSAEIKAEMLFISGYGVKYWREGGEYMDLYTHWQYLPEFKE